MTKSPQDNKKEIRWLLGELKHGHPADKIEAMIRAAELKAMECVEQISQLLQDPDAGVRYTAIKMLGFLGSKEHAKEVAKFLKGDSLPSDRIGPSPDTVKAYAAMALARMGAKEYTKEIIQLLTCDGYPSSHYERSEVAWALKKLQAQDHVKEIAKLLEHKNERVRESAATTLGILGAKEYTKKIAQLLGQPEISGGVAIALAELGATEYEDEIASMIDSDSIYEKACAIEALGILKSRKHLKKIEQLLRTPEGQNRAICGYAASAILQIDHYPYEKLLKALCKDDTRIWIYDRYESPLRIDTTVGELAENILWYNNFIRYSEEADEAIWRHQPWAKEGGRIERDAGKIKITGAGILLNVEDRHFGESIALERAKKNTAKLLNSLIIHVAQACIKGVPEISKKGFEESVTHSVEHEFNEWLMPEYSIINKYFDYKSKTWSACGAIDIDIMQFTNFFKQLIMSHIGESEANEKKAEESLNTAINSFLEKK